MNLAKLKAIVAAYHQKTIDDLTVDSTDLFLVAANNARKNAELLHDFELSRVTATLDIDGVSGGRLADAVMMESGLVTVTGTLSPDAAGSYVRNGSFDGYALYTKSGATTFFLYYNSAASSYVISTTLSTGAVTNKWVPTEPQTLVSGTYAAEGANTGAATVLASSLSFSGIKEVVALSGLRNSTDFVPFDFTRADVSIERDRYELEISDDLWGRSWRYPSDADLLNRAGGSTIALRGGGLYIFPRRNVTTSATPLTVYIEGYGWLKDYTEDMVDDDTAEPQDFLLEHGFEYLQWDIIIKLNPVFQTFVPRQEGNPGPPSREREEAWRNLILWDSYMVDSHSTTSR
jgi:hypothetical protein